MNRILEALSQAAGIPHQLNMDFMVGFPRLSFLMDLVGDGSIPALPATRICCAAPGDSIIPPANCGESPFTLAHTLTLEHQERWRAHLLDVLAWEIDNQPQTDAIQRSILRLSGHVGGGSCQFRFWPHKLCLSRATILRSEDQTRSCLSAGDFSPEVTGTAGEPRTLQEGTAAQQVAAWFDGKWSTSQELTAEIKEILLKSWACQLLSPEDAYYKVLIEYFSEMLDFDDRTDDYNPLLERMAEFQRDAYFHAKGILRRFGGVFISDVVGLGKTYIGMALLKYFTESQDIRALVITPPRLCEMWSKLTEQFEIECKIVSHAMLGSLKGVRRREIVLIDESHNFRNAHTQRYKALMEYLRPGLQSSRNRIILLSATPQNNTCWDVYRQLRLFPDTYSPLPHTAEQLDQYFRQVESGQADLSSLLRYVLVRRTRSFVKREYPNATLPGVDLNGKRVEKPIVFPRRLDGEAMVLRYSIEEVYDGLYGHILKTLANLTYARYGLADYLEPAQRRSERYSNLNRAGRSLRGLFKALLLKRCESSIEAFKDTLAWLILTHEGCVEAIRTKNIVPVNPRHRTGKIDVDDLEADDLLDLFQGDYPGADFDTLRLLRDLSADLCALRSLKTKLDQICAPQDAKLLRLRRHLQARPPGSHRTLLFTQFSATAHYVHENILDLVPDAELITGQYGNQHNILSRFSPNSMGEQASTGPAIPLLISTDVLSEGVNLQDADTLINYDLHWNPVRLIQRAGRIDRIGSEHEEIRIYNFLPEVALEKALGLASVLRSRIEELLRVFGDDSAVLPLDYSLSPEATVFDVYTGKALEDSDEEPTFDGFAHHLEQLFNLRRSSRARFDTLKALRPGQRAIINSNGTQTTVMCQAGWYKQFYQTKAAGESQQVDATSALDTFARWAREEDFEQQAAVHSGLNKTVFSALDDFRVRVLNLMDQQSRPALERAEQWVRDQFIRLYPTLSSEEQEELNRMIGWIDRGQHKTRFKSSAQRWRREKLPAESIRMEMKNWLSQYPLTEEALPEPTSVVAVWGD